MASITVEKEKMVDLVKLYPQPRRRKIFVRRKEIGKEKRSRGGRKIFGEGKYFFRRRRKRRKIC